MKDLETARQGEEFICKIILEHERSNYGFLDSVVSFIWWDFGAMCSPAACISTSRNDFPLPPIHNCFTLILMENIMRTRKGELIRTSKKKNLVVLHSWTNDCNVETTMPRWATKCLSDIIPACCFRQFVYMTILIFKIVDVKKKKLKTEGYIQLIQSEL